MEADFWSKLTDSEKESFGQLQATLGSPGWKTIVRDLEERSQGLFPVLMNPQSWDAHMYARGVRDGIALLLGIEERIQLEYSQAVAEREAAEEVEEPDTPSEPFA